MSHYSGPLRPICRVSPFTCEWHLIVCSKDVPEFDRQCRMKPHLLSRLTSLTITINSTSAWEEDVSSLVASSTLECLLLCGSDTVTDTGAQMDNFITALVSAHGSHLRNFSLHRLLISPQALGDLCVGIKGLRRLSIWIRFRHLVSSWPKISSAVNLRVSESHRGLVV
jgi:hypothetical protein